MNYGIKLLISLIHSIKDVQLTNLTLIDNKRDRDEVILQCSILGLHPNETDIEIRFNDKRLYSCEHRKNQSDDTPYTKYINNRSTCELHFQRKPSYNGEYYCTAKIHTGERNRCFYLESRTIELIIPETQSPISHEQKIQIIIGVSLGSAMIFQFIAFFICMRHYYQKKIPARAAPLPPPQPPPQPPQPDNPPILDNPQQLHVRLHADPPPNIQHDERQPLVNRDGT